MSAGRIMTTIAGGLAVAATALSTPRASAQPRRAVQAHSAANHLIALSSVDLTIAIDTSLSLIPHAAEIGRQAPTLGTDSMQLGDHISRLDHGDLVRTILDQDLVTAEDVATAVRALRHPVRPVDNWTSLYVLLRRVEDAETARRGRRAVLVWLTDAASSLPSRRATEIDWNKALALARKLHPSVKAVLVGVPSSTQAPSRLRALAGALGARLVLLNANDNAAAEVSKALAEVRTVVREQRQAGRVVSSSESEPGRRDGLSSTLRWIGFATLLCAGAAGYAARRYGLLRSGAKPAAPARVAYATAQLTVVRLGGPLRHTVMPRVVGTTLLIRSPLLGRAEPVAIGGVGSPIPLARKMLELVFQGDCVEVRPEPGVVVTSNGAPVDVPMAWPAILDVSNGLRIHIREPKHNLRTDTAEGGILP